MPIDPSIALGVKPAEFASPVQQFAQAQALKNQQLQGQVHQQQVEHGALALQEQQRSVTEGQKLRELFAQPGMDMKTALPEVFKINPNTALALQKGMHEAEKAALDTDKVKIELNANKAKRFGSIAGSMKDEATFHSGIATAVGEGLVDSKTALALLEQGWTPDTQAQVAQIVNGSMTAVEQHTKELADLEEARKKLTDKHNEELRPYQVQTAAGQAASASVDPATGLNPQQTQQAAQAAATLTQTTQRNVDQAANEKTLREQGAGRLKVEQAAQNLRERTHRETLGAGLDANGQPRVGADGKPLSGDAYLAILDPGMAAQVRAIAEGRQTQLPRGKEASAMMRMVNQYDPTYTNQRAETRKAFAPGGRVGQNLQALNTAPVHLDQLSEAAKALNNGTFKRGNAIFNALVTEFGAAAPTNFEGVRAAVASEMASALKGNATDIEIEAINKTISSAGSPKALAGIIETNMHVLGAKLNTRDEEWHAQKLDADYTPVFPTTRAVFERHGIQPIERLKTKTAAAGGGAASGGYIVGRKYGDLTYLGGDHNSAASWKK